MGNDAKGTTESLLIQGQLTIELVSIPPGEFLMGSTQGLDLERPVHHVKLRHAFGIGKYLITQEQWASVMGNNPSCFQSEDGLPVDSVSFEDVQTFCDRVSSWSGRAVRLPSEAEWEYACRVGSSDEFFFGNDDRIIHNKPVDDELYSIGIPSRDAEADWPPIESRFSPPDVPIRTTLTNPNKKPVKPQKQGAPNILWKVWVFYKNVTRPLL